MHDKKKKVNGEARAWFDDGYDLKSRRIYVGNATFNAEGEEKHVNAQMAEYAIKGLELLGTDNPKRPIRMLLNTLGGDVVNGYAIFDAIRHCPAPVHIEAIGSAMSMGAIILLAGDKRAIYPNATIMVHDGTGEDGSQMTARSSENWNDYWRSKRPSTYELFASRTNKNYEFWDNAFSHDTVFNAEKALKVGLVDRIIWPAKLFSEKKKR